MGDGRLQAAKPRSVRAMRVLRTIRRPAPGRKIESPHLQNSCQLPRRARRSSAEIDYGPSVRCLGGKTFNPRYPMIGYLRPPCGHLVSEGRNLSWKSSHDLARLAEGLNQVGGSLHCSEALRRCDQSSCAKQAIVPRGRRARGHAGRPRHARTLRE